MSLKYLFKTLIVALLTLSSLSCKKNNTDYNITSSIDAFSKIELHSAFVVYLTEDSVHSITAVGREDVVKELIYTVIDGTLIIEDPRKSEWRTPKSNKVELYVTSPPLSKVTTFEACVIKTLKPITSQEFGLVLGGKANEATLQLNCDAFYHWGGSVSGGKITLTGTSNGLNLWSTGLVQIDAFDLQTDYVFIENKSRGNCEVNVASKIDYSIFNSGDIIVHGNPGEINELVKKEEALGQLIIK